MQQLTTCPVCGQTTEQAYTNCPNCSLSDSIEATPSSSSISKSGGGFRTEYFAELAALEESNFWFIARNHLVIWAIKKYCNNFSSFLEIGCGTGYVISGVANSFPDRKIFGTELYNEGLKYAKKRVPSAEFNQLDARKIPYRSKFDIVGAFDVLEHIQEDEAVLAQVALTLNDNGYLILTVPQHKWLWSPTDEYACHVRRYSKQELHDKIRCAGFDIKRSSSFVSSLMPAIIFSRLSQKRKGLDEIDPKAEFKIPKVLNAIFLSMLMIEKFLISIGINLPFGSSRLVVAKKTEVASST